MPIGPPLFVLGDLAHCACGEHRSPPSGRYVAVTSWVLGEFKGMSRNRAGLRFPFIFRPVRAKVASHNRFAIYRLYGFKSRLPL